MADYLNITLECNGLMLCFGKSASGEKLEFGITKYSGLESADMEISSTENALVDGSTLDGKRIKNRPIHIEATLRDDRSNELNRQRIIKFFNPKYTGKMTIDHSGTKRNIEYELEGWNFTNTDVYDQISIVVDLKCLDPFMKNIDNFGKNMADVSRHIAFPWCVLKNKKYEVADPYKSLTLGGQITGYRTLKKEVLLPNDGDVPTGVQIEFIAERGTVKNPKITLLKKKQNKFMRINVTMNQGDVLLVDTDKRHQVITLNGVNAYQKIDRRSEPFELEVGDNYLQYDADENYTNLDVKLYYTPMYLGV